MLPFSRWSQRKFLFSIIFTKFLSLSPLSMLQCLCLVFFFPFFLFLLFSLSSIPAQILRYNKTCFLKLKFFVGPIGSNFRITRTRFWCHCDILIFTRKLPTKSLLYNQILQRNGFRAVTNVKVSIVVKTFHIF